MRLAYSYTLQRKMDAGKDFRSNQAIVEKARKEAESRRKGDYVEQDLGTMPIPIKDYLYKPLEI